MLQSVLDETETKSPNVLRIIETISKHNNTPRKKPKFVNFVKNVCGQKTNPKDIDQAWDLISVKLAALSQVNGNRNSKESVNAESSGKSDVKPNGNSDSKPNGNSDDNVKNGDEVGETKDEENGTAENDVPKANGNGDVPDKKLSKKQRKEEKKKKKYEAELQDAEQPSEEVDELQSKKKGKKNKNKEAKTNGTDEAEDDGTEGKNKKKRKRQDTVNTIPEVVDNENAIENSSKVKVQQKKKRVDPEEDSVTLHDQNVAKNDEQTKNESFNWHAVIVSVLQKKDNEVPFKRLQKKVLSEYSEITGNDVDDRIAEKFIKKLKSAPNVRVDKNRVVLIQDNDD